MNQSPVSATFPRALVTIDSIEMELRKSDMEKVNEALKPTSRKSLDDEVQRIMDHNSPTFEGRTEFRML